MVLSVERYQRRVVAGEEPAPVLVTVAVRVMVLEGVTLVLLALGALTMRSGAGVVVSAILIKTELSELCVDQPPRIVGVNLVVNLICDPHGGAI